MPIPLQWALDHGSIYNSGNYAFTADVTNLSFCAGFDFRVSFLADDLVDAFLWTLRDSREGFIAVVSKITVDAPVFTVVPRTFDVHRFGTERFEGHDQMGEHEFCFEIDLRNI